VPNTRLRLIALIVSEPNPDRFQWKLLESAGHDAGFTIALATGTSTFTSYSQALREGEAVLMALAGRSPTGPRAPPVLTDATQTDGR
jgi:hypothetical protein